MNSLGRYSWTVAVEGTEPDLQAVNDYLDRQQRYDPDLWIVELDTANLERFVDDELL